MKFHYPVNYSRFLFCSRLRPHFHHLKHFRSHRCNLQTTRWSRERKENFHNSHNLFTKIFHSLFAYFFALLLLLVSRDNDENQYFLNAIGESDFSLRSNISLSSENNLQALISASSLVLVSLLTLRLKMKKVFSLSRANQRDERGIEVIHFVEAKIDYGRMKFISIQPCPLLIS